MEHQLYRSFSYHGSWVLILVLVIAFLSRFESETMGGTILSLSVDEKKNTGSNYLFEIRSDGYSNWFAEPPPFVHGIGISRLSNYFPEQSYEDAFEKAIEDLNSNTRVLVTYETFTLGAGTFRSFSEVAIDEKYQKNKVTRVDSLIKDGHIYYMVSDSGERFNPTEKSALPEPVGLFIESGDAMKIGDYWYAAGKSDLSKISLYRSWARAKKAALKNMGASLTTLVQSLQKRDGLFDAGSIRYTRSQVMLNNVRVVSRRSQSDTAICIIAVHEDDITRLSKL